MNTQNKTIVAFRTLAEKLPVDGWVLLFIFFGTLAMVFPYVFPLDGFIPYRNNYLEDSGEMTWNLWFVTESVLDFKNPFVTDMVFYPVGTNLGTHTLISGWFPVAALVKLLTLGSDYYPIYAFNIIVFLSYLSLASFTYLSLRRLGVSVFAALIPAFGYAFCSFYYWHWKHLNLMAMFSAPLMLYLGLRLWERPTRGRAVLFSAAFAWCVYLTEMTVFVAMAAALFVLVALPIPSLRKPFVAKLKALGVINITVASVLFLAAVAPFLYYYSISDIEPPIKGYFSSLAANAAALFLPARNGTTLYGTLFEPLASQVTKALGGREVFIGFPMLLFLMVGLYGRKPAPYWISFIFGLFFISLSFGPTLRFLSVDTKIPMPYKWLMEVPPFTQNRCPVRIALIGIFFLTPLIAHGLERGFRFSSRRIGAKAGYALMGAVFIWTVAESYTLPPQKRIAYTINESAIAEMEDGPAVTTSLPFRACNQVVLQIFHKKPMAEFCWARLTKEQKRHHRELLSARNVGPERFVSVLSEKGFKNIIVDNRIPLIELEAFRKSSLKTVEIVPHPKRVSYAVGAENLRKNLRSTSKTAWTLEKGFPKVVPLPKRMAVSSVELLADVGDGYRVTLYDQERRVKKIVLGPLRQRGKRGLQWKIDSEDRLDEPRFADSLEIEVMEGRAPFNIGALVIGGE